VIAAEHERLPLVQFMPQLRRRVQRRVGRLSVARERTWIIAESEYTTLRRSDVVKTDA